MHVRRYALYGALFGLFFPVCGTVLQTLFDPASGEFAAKLARAQSMPLLWIIDTAPLFLGLFASFAGMRQDEIIALEAAKRAAFAETAGELFNGAQTLLSTVSSFTSITTETAASVRETTATMTQLGHTATQAALTAETVVGLASTSKKCSEDGLRAVETSMAEMIQLAEEVRGLSKTIEGLNERMHDIFEIASVVNYIADRSQRLAESARAEIERNVPARDFTNILAEMRHQSEDSKKAAAQVMGILGEMHKAMLKAMAAAEKGVRRAEQGANVAVTTGDNIKRLATALRDSSKAARDIALVAQQQDHGIDEVLKAMNEIYLATEETMESTHRVASEAKELNDIALRLDRSVRVECPGPMGSDDTFHLKLKRLVSQRLRRRVAPPAASTPSR